MTIHAAKTHLSRLLAQVEAGEEIVLARGSQPVAKLVPYRAPARLEHPIPLCADESCRTRADLDRLDGKYEAINIKLDKAGGLTEALALAEAAKRRGLRIMVGGGISTSLGIAPALLVAQLAEIVDLDGPLCLALDRGVGLRYDGGTICPPDPKFWGGAG